MKLTRKQELALIDIGLRVHLDNTLTISKPKDNQQHKKKFVHKWSKAQRDKFHQTWLKKHGKKNG